jgi:FkbM family methyltransferase
MIRKPFTGSVQKTKSILRNLRASIRHPLSVESYSHEGEDMVLLKHFGGKRDGFYVDVGAHHPVRFSNTYSFYKQGWRGINIDAMPGSMRAFNKVRPRDINVEAAVSDKVEQLQFYVFNVPALNSFSKELADKLTEGGKYQVVDTLQLKTRRLTEIMDLHLPAGQAIDFLSIDAEGLDVAVLRSLDWKKYRPALVLVELHDFKLQDSAHHPACALLRDAGYELFAKTYSTTFFIDSSSR